jgi:serine/threonine protein phosphatase PrpC
MSLAVTRSLGDFYHQHFGVTHLPEVVVLDLKAEQPASSADGGCVLLIASDGVWDHWKFDDAMEKLIDPRTGKTDRARTEAMMEETRAKGEEVFGSTADNLTGIAVVLPRVP